MRFSDVSVGKRLGASFSLLTALIVVAAGVGTRAANLLPKRLKERGDANGRELPLLMGRNPRSGVDFLALGRATGSFFSPGRIVSGGSTITMQTARLLLRLPASLR